MKMLKIALVCAVALTAAGRVHAGELGAPGTPVAAEQAKQAPGAKEQAQLRYLAGLKYFQAGDHEKARAEWSAAAAIDPQNPDVKAGLERVRQVQAAPAAPAKAPVVGLVKGYRGTPVTVGGDQLLFVKKGDRVDVLVTFDARMEDKDGKERKEKITSTFLQNVVVINVHKPAKVSEAGAVELLLNPVEAQYAALAIAQGNVNIVVRAPGDTEMHPMEIASFRKLIK